MIEQQITLKSNRSIVREVPNDVAVAYLAYMGEPPLLIAALNVYVYGFMPSLPWSGQATTSSVEYVDNIR